MSKAKKLETFDDLRELMKTNQHWDWTKILRHMIDTFYFDDKDYFYTVLYQNLEASCIHHMEHKYKKLPKDFDKYLTNELKT